MSPITKGETGSILLFLRNKESQNVSSSALGEVSIGLRN